MDSAPAPLSTLKLKDCDFVSTARIIFFYTRRAEWELSRID